MNSQKEDNDNLRTRLFKQHQFDITDDPSNCVERLLVALGQENSQLQKEVGRIETELAVWSSAKQDLQMEVQIIRKRSELRQNDLLTLLSNTLRNRAAGAQALLQQEYYLSSLNRLMVQQLESSRSAQLKLQQQIAKRCSALQSGCRKATGLQQEEQSMKRMTRQSQEEITRLNKQLGLKMKAWQKVQNQTSQLQKTYMNLKREVVSAEVEEAAPPQSLQPKFDQLARQLRSKKDEIAVLRQQKQFLEEQLEDQRSKCLEAQLQAQSEENQLFRLQLEIEGIRQKITANVSAQAQAVAQAKALQNNRKKEDVVALACVYSLAEKDKAQRLFEQRLKEQRAEWALQQYSLNHTVQEHGPEIKRKRELAHLRRGQAEELRRARQSGEVGQEVLQRQREEMARLQRQLTQLASR